MTSEPLYSMDLKERDKDGYKILQLIPERTCGAVEMVYLSISVVMIRQEDSGLIWTSPVRSPTSPKVFLKSRNF